MHSMTSGASSAIIPKKHRSQRVHLEVSRKLSVTPGASDHFSSGSCPPRRLTQRHVETSTQHHSPRTRVWCMLNTPGCPRHMLVGHHHFDFSPRDPKCFPILEIGSSISCSVGKSHKCACGQEEFLNTGECVTVFVVFVLNVEIPDFARTFVNAHLWFVEHRRFVQRSV